MNMDVIDWLLNGDVSIQYLTKRDLLGQKDKALQERIAQEGWGALYLKCQNADGTWGRAFYQPKWTSSHYTLLDLKTFGLPPDNSQARLSIEQILYNHTGPDGGVNPSETIKQSDVCINGMFLNYACYFNVPEHSIHTVVDFVLGQRMEDGGFNCQRNRSGAHHSSMHSTISVLEGILSYRDHGYSYRVEELQQVAREAEEFLLMHRLYKSDRTGKVIHREFLKFSFPSRWKYNILRALDYFQAALAPWDPSMADALGVVLAKRTPEGYWRAEAAHPGATHLIMETPRKPGRWNTLLALRILKAYEAEIRSIH
ncbi:MAG: hypothetical protein JXA25_18330 [Anaerolineales bacterium]|nr:hypothetical protein [Anaerolineales bacterium]